MRQFQYFIIYDTQTEIQIGIRFFVIGFDCRMNINWFCFSFLG